MIKLKMKNLLCEKFFIWKANTTNHYIFCLSIGKNTFFVAKSFSSTRPAMFKPVNCKRSVRGVYSVLKGVSGKMEDKMHISRQNVILGDIRIVVFGLFINHFIIGMKLFSSIRVYLEEYFFYLPHNS
jgi:hypothetical protein